MPAQPYWYRRIPSIRHWLEAIDDPFIDRRGVEIIWQVSPRDAQRILRRAGAVRLGNVNVAIRWRLLEWLRRVEKEDAAAGELLRVDRLEEKLEEQRAEMVGRKVRIHADLSVEEVKDLPAGVRLRPGKLEIEFFGTEDLLRHLFELAQVLTHDFVRIQQIIEE